MSAAPLLLLMAVLGFLAAGMVVVYHLASVTFWTLAKLLRGVAALGRHVLGFVRDESIDAVQTIGAGASSVAIGGLALGNLFIGRGGSVRQYGHALGEELVATVGGVYRLALANPLRLVGLGSVVRRIERHLPEQILRGPRSRAEAPRLAYAPNVVEPPSLHRPARAARAAAHGDHGFEGYQVVGELPAGGSGARLFLAHPEEDTVERLRAGGVDVPREVVIKAFVIAAGSTLPQIVREGRALEAARRLGLVLQHSLDDERFWYVMPYVRGRELGDVTTAMHVRCGADGLDEGSVRKVAGYTSDVLAALERFHEDGLWHKDVKPSNVVVTEDTAHLVDLGLVTPLGSAMTLTTHGTEYYRDPELVRQALRGAKVNEVDGVKFDLYAVGALLYSMLENSFPAHGNLSRITRRCPEALSFVVRRAMADHADRYATAAEMRADLVVVAAAADPFAVLPLELPSFRRAMAEDEDAAPRRRPRQESARTLRVAADPPARSARAEANANRSLAGVASSVDAREARAHRRRHRRKHGLTTFALMLCGLVFVTRILPVIAQGTDPSGMRNGETRLAGWFEDRLRSLERATAEDGRSWGREAEALAVAEETLRQRRTELLRAELGPLLEREGASALPSWSRGPHVLILDDVPEGRERPDLDPVVTLLEESGYGVLGTGVDRADSDFAFDLEASARHALGLADDASAEAIQRLQAFLDASTELDAVLWLAPDAGGDGIERLLLLPSGVPQAAASTEVSGDQGHRPPTDVVRTTVSFGDGR